MSGGLEFNMKLRRFYYHYNKIAKRMSVHYKGICYITENINCLVPSETKYNKRQPFLVMRGFCRDMDINRDLITIY